MAKKKPPSQQSLSRFPTGATNPLPSNKKSQTPDSSSAVKPKEFSTPLAGISAQPLATAQEGSPLILAKEIETPNLETLATETGKVTEARIAPSSSAVAQQSPADLWKGFVKEASVKLCPKETPFTLDSGEACVMIPNTVVEKNKKAWEYFILGQFYEEPPARGAIHAIVNGIWSRQKRDISVNKMDGNAFLFRVPCPNARRRILSQNLWQIDGQTMFVTKWSPGIQQLKPELAMIPVWLEFTNVPLQFFNKDALQEIAGLVGHPVCLHPATENLTNIEVAKVYTVIDPRKPLLEFVNARFESGDTRRIAVSCPWLPSLCAYCKKFGHTITRCKSAPKTCVTCNSVQHATSSCPRKNHLPSDAKKQKGKEPIRSLLPIVGQQKMGWKPVGTKTVETTTALDKDPGPKDNTPIIPSPISEVPSPPTTERSDQTVSVTHDLSKGSLYVDLSTDGCSLEKQSSTTSSSVSSLSGDEDNPDDDSDRFIEFFSKRYQKRSNKKARARGPLTL
ncbi:hypothetical protein N665_0339s0109 [Sinapis alba]|nr:hypothetical protein N665_0339s0109 [Sinapis alba]